MRFFLLLLYCTTKLVRLSRAQSCGVDTVLDPTSNSCICTTDITQDPNEIKLSGIFDLTSYEWGYDIFNVTVQLLNNGWMNALASGQRITYDLGNANCDETQAVQVYWDIRTNNFNRPPHGIIGTRCSGSAISLARVSGLEAVPQVSGTANSARLTDDVQFPYFSRLVAPNDERGEVGALIALLSEFGWERVTILATDTTFAKDLVTEFRKGWVGERKGSVAYSDTFRLLPDGEIDQESVRQALNGVPTDDPTINSRIILLVAHSQHAFHVLREATLMNFQPDTVWVGPSSWVGRTDTIDFDWLPKPPGYLGVAPFRNRNTYYTDFLGQLKTWQRNNGRPITEELPVFAAETVDAIVAMAMAISRSAPLFRDGPRIVRELRSLSFEGVSGFVEFTEEGDRKNPLFSVLNGQSGTQDGVDWTDVGSTGTDIGSTIIEGSVCYAVHGCDPDEAISDRYPVEPDKLPAWVTAVIVVFAVLFVGLALKYWRSRRSKSRIVAELEAFRDSVVGMRAAECDYVPKVVKGDDGDDVEQALSGKVVVAASPIETVVWCWQETDQMMSHHDPSVIYGDPADCWIKYDMSCTEKLEEAYADGQTEFSPLQGYTVNFSKMLQTKLATGFQRKVQRVVEKGTANDEDGATEIDLGSVKIGSDLPRDLKDEPQMVLVQGDVVQVSTQRQDGWAFGTKLHHADEAAARQLVLVASGAQDGNVDEDANIFADTGWFPLEATRLPSVDDLAALEKKIDTGGLDAPPHWDDITDPTLAQKHQIKKSEPEYHKLVDSFMSTLAPPSFSKKVNIVKVERIQNLAMWQSFVVKRQTICYRETDGDTDAEIQRKARERFEKSWLWHGCSFEVVDKILQQGFNRSFCGKNATAYGKGVYFARDAAYSAYPLYSAPDPKGHQHIMACRVVVGEYCRGKHDALTPDVRDVKSHSLYDSTVGLLSGDTMSNPSIYVTYHDAQAYPEYLITFKTS